MNSYCTPELKEKFDKILRENKIVVVSNLGHPFCEKLNKLFKKNSIDFFEMDMIHPEYDDLIPCIHEKSKSRFKPQIYVKSNYIGGYTEALNYFVLGKFKKFKF